MVFCWYPTFSFLHPQVREKEGVQCPASVQGCTALCRLVTGTIILWVKSPHSTVMQLTGGRCNAGTLFGATTIPVIDNSGGIAPFCDATGQFMPLLCTMNCTLAPEEVVTLQLKGLIPKQRTGRG